MVSITRMGQSIVVERRLQIHQADMLCLWMPPISWFRKASSILKRRDDARWRGGQLQRMRQEGRGDPQQLTGVMMRRKKDMQDALAEWEEMKYVTSKSSLRFQRQNLRRPTSQRVPLQRNLDRLGIEVELAVQGDYLEHGSGPEIL